MPPVQSRAPEPKAFDRLFDESGCVIDWLASAWSIEDIANEWDWLFENKPASEVLGERWYRFRWTTPEELADKDLLFYLFGDYEMSGADTSVVCCLAAPESPGTHRYWTTEAPRA